MLVSTRVESADQDTSVLADHSRMALGEAAKDLGSAFRACLLTGCMRCGSWVGVCDANGVASAGAGAHVPGDLAGGNHEGSRPVSSVKCKLKYSQPQSRHGVAKRNALQIKH